MINNLDLALRAKLSLDDREAARFLNSWLIDKGCTVQAFSQMPVMERSILTSNTMKLNRLNEKKMDEERWLSLASSLSFTLFYGGNVGMDLLHKHFATANVPHIYWQILTWRWFSKRGMNYFYYGINPNTNNKSAAMFRKINKKGNMSGPYFI